MYLQSNKKTRSDDRCAGKTQAEGEAERGGGHQPRIFLSKKPFHNVSVYINFSACSPLEDEVQVGLVEPDEPPERAAQRNPSLERRPRLHQSLPPQSQHDKPKVALSNACLYCSSSFCLCSRGRAILSSPLLFKRLWRTAVHRTPTTYKLLNFSTTGLNRQSVIYSNLSCAPTVQ